jgi:hypothetical protein
MFTYYQQRATILAGVNVLIVALLVTIAFFPNVLAGAKSDANEIYIPFSADRSEWGDHICAGMTTGGCDYFRSAEMDAAWIVLSNLDAKGASVRYVERILDLGHGLELWKMDLVIVRNDEDAQEYSMYATARNIDGNLHLDRVVSIGGLLLVQE